MSQITNYIKESYSELVTKVTWPTWKELQESSVLVFVASLLIAGVVFVMDWAFGVNTSDSIWKGVVGTIYDLFQNALETMSEIEKKWYVVRAVSGQEKRVKETIETEVAAAGLQDYVGQVLIPIEQTIMLMPVEIGDYTDIVGGRDIKLTTVGPEVTGTPYNKTSIGPSLKITPLSSEEDVVNTLLNDQADPMKVFKPLSYDEMKGALQEWLSPEDNEEEGSIVKEPAVAFEAETPAKEEKKFTLSTQGTPKKAKSEEFDSLFDDDLPF